MTAAINPSTGYYEIGRMFLNVIFLFIVFFTISNEPSSVLKICKVVLLVSLLQSVIGILQYYDVAFSDLPGANPKPFGLMANRNLFIMEALVLCH